MDVRLKRRPFLVCYMVPPLSIDVCVPRHHLHMPLLHSPLYKATCQWQVQDAHLWMTVPYHAQDHGARSVACPF